MVGGGAAVMHAACRSRVRWSAAPLVAVVAVGALLLSGCLHAVPDFRARSPQVRVTLAGGCPASVDPRADASNDKSGLTKSLVPRGLLPVGGIICSYRSALLPNYPPVPLVRSVALSQARATTLAATIAAISLKRAGGTTSCPNADTHTANIIVLSYDGGRPDVDVWHDAVGCQSVDNGFVIGYQVGSPSFGAFQRALGAVLSASTVTH